MKLIITRKNTSIAVVNFCSFFLRSQKSMKFHSLFKTLRISDTFQSSDNFRHFSEPSKNLSLFKTIRISVDFENRRKICHFLVPLKFPSLLRTVEKSVTFQDRQNFLQF